MEVGDAEVIAKAEKTPLLSGTVVAVTETVAVVDIDMDSEVAADADEEDDELLGGSVGDVDEERKSNWLETVRVLDAGEAVAATCRTRPRIRSP